MEKIKMFDEYVEEKVDQPLSEAYTAVAEMASRLGIKSINKYPSYWEFKLVSNMDVWHIYVNGHDKAIPCKATVYSHLQPFQMIVFRNTVPVGVAFPRRSLFTTDIEQPLVSDLERIGPWESNVKFYSITGPGGDSAA
jgi:hypothetical protein